MDTEDIYKHLQLKDQNLAYWKKEAERLRMQIENMNSIKKVPNEFYLHNLSKDLYTKEEIEIAYNRTLKYEGLESRQGGLITDTLISFLAGTHHSLKDQFKMDPNF